MLDSNGCNTTAATTVARIAKARSLDGNRAVVLGLGAVGLRSATLLQQEGCAVAVASLPADLFGDDRPYHRPRGLSVAENLGLEIREPSDRSELEATVDGASIVLAAGPAGVEVLRRDAWAAAESVELLADYNAAEPLGIEGTKATDDLAEYDGKLVLGALAIDTDSVYAIAKELV
jgi:hypothetical protein